MSPRDKSKSPPWGVVLNEEAVAAAAAVRASAGAGDDSSAMLARLLDAAKQFSAETARDRFAAIALRNILQGRWGLKPTEAACLAWDFADAMMDERHARDDPAARAAAKKGGAERSTGEEPKNEDA